MAFKFIQIFVLLCSFVLFNNNIIVSFQSRISCNYKISPDSDICKVVIVIHTMQPVIAILFHGDGVSLILLGTLLLFKLAGWLPDMPSLHIIAG